MECVSGWTNRVIITESSVAPIEVAKRPGLVQGATRGRGAPRTSANAEPRTHVLRRAVFGRGAGRGACDPPPARGPSWITTSRNRRIRHHAGSSDLPGVVGSIFLDLTPPGISTRTLLEKLNESRTIPSGRVGLEGRIHLFNKRRLTRRHRRTARWFQSDVFACGFRPWREEEPAEICCWTERCWRVASGCRSSAPSQRISDYMNEGVESVALITPVARAPGERRGGGGDPGESRWQERRSPRSVSGGFADP